LYRTSNFLRKISENGNSSNVGENSCLLECCAEFTGKQSKKATWPVKKESLLSIEASGTTHSTPNREIGILDYTATKIPSQTYYNIPALCKKYLKLRKINV
jgi:hypothetical protein